MDPLSFTLSTVFKEKLWFLNFFINIASGEQFVLHLFGVLDIFQLVYKAVYGMLPKDLRRRTFMMRLHLFPDDVSTRSCFEGGHLIVIMIAVLVEET